MSDGTIDDAKQCKIFIGGLHLLTTTESLQEYFSTWGDIVDAVVVKDPETKRSRGFGFVTFTKAQSVDDCLSARPHKIDNKDVEAKRAVPKEESTPQAHNRTKKVFLGGLSLDTCEQDIRDVLEGFGPVVEVQIMKDKNTDKPRGFGFAIFDDCDTVDKLCIKKYVRVRDRDVEVKKAISQEEMRRTDFGKSPQRYSYPPRETYRDPYGGAGGYRGFSGGFGNDYRQMAGGYDYSRYATSEYMRPEAYMGAGAGGYSAVGGYAADRTSGYPGYPGYPARGYDMSAYGSSMYGQAGMGTYTQGTSTYGPTRDRERGGAAGGLPTRAHQYHPYRR